MTPLGIGIVGTGNIAGGYARDTLTHPEIRLVGGHGSRPGAGRTRSPPEHGCRAHATARRPARRRRVDIVVNLTVHHAHYEVTTAGARGRPACLQREAARPAPERGARARRAGRCARASPRLLAVDIPRRGATDRRRAHRRRPARDGPGRLCRGRLGPDRDLAPRAGAVLRRRASMVDVGGLSTHARHGDVRPGAIRPGLGLGSQARPGHASTGPRSGSAARTSSWPRSSSRPGRSCGSRRASTSADRRWSTARWSSMATTRSLAIGSFQEFDAAVEAGRYGGDYERSIW